MNKINFFSKLLLYSQKSSFQDKKGRQTKFLENPGNNNNTIRQANCSACLKKICFLLHPYLNQSQINGAAWMGLNFYDYHDFQKHQEVYRIMNNTVVLVTESQVNICYHNITNVLLKPFWEARPNNLLPTDLSFV